MLLLITLALAASACVPKAQVDASAGPGSTYVSDARAPARYRRNVRATLATVSPSDVDRLCRPPGQPPVCGYRIEACTSTAGVITLPNPAAFPRDPYARLLAHELAHVQGWPATHGP